MNKEKEIEEFAFSLIGATSPLGVKDLTKQFDYKTVAEYLINAGYGNVKQAVKEFANYIQTELNNILKKYKPKPSDNLTQAIYVISNKIDNLVKKFYGEE